MGLGVTTPDYQVGAHFKALNESVRVAALKFTGYFFMASLWIGSGADWP